MTDISDSQAFPPDSSYQRPTPPTASSQDLKYPQILLEASFNSLLTHSFPSTTTVAMEPTPQPPLAPPSLSESWASISDADYSHDEDLQSEMTDAGSLLDVHSANDVQSVNEGTQSEDGSGDEEHDVRESLTQPQPQVDLQSSAQGQTPAASRYTSTSPQTNEITLDEPVLHPDDKHVLVKHTLTPFSDSEALRLQLPTSSQDGYVGTLHMTLSKSPLQKTSRSSFRLLLLGLDYTESLRTSLVNKIADALVASHSDIESPTPPSRYHIVPDSFGPGSQPAAAEVIPVDRTLDVESFHSGTLGGENNKNVILCNEHTVGRTLSTFDERQGRYVAATRGWQQPDLAIIVIDSTDPPDVRLSACSMMIFAKRLKIPIMVLRMDNDWNADFAPLIFADASAQLCIEKRPLSQDSVLRTLPLDLSTFLNINPAQLGRHIAYLVRSPEASPKSLSKNVADQEAPDCDILVVKAKKFCQDMVSRVQSAGLSQTLCMIAVLAGTLILLQSVVLLKTSWNARYQGPVPSLPETLNIDPGIPAFTPSVPVAFSSSTNPVPLTIGSQLASTKRFEAETLGNSHIIVRTPDKSSKSQKFSIDVRRKDKKIETETTILFPGVFSVRLEPVQAYGDLNVCFAASKLTSQECVEVVFGRQSFAGWITEWIEDGENRLQQQLALLHGSLEEMRNSERPRDAMKEARKRLLELEHAAEQGLKSRWAMVSAWRLRVAETITALHEKVQKDMSAARESRKAARFAPAVNIREQFARFWQNRQEQIQSERLATSQERAQRIVKELRERLGY